ncbi:MAG: hypothetical protein IJ285_04530 [Clostridia bacterium]|nr:hypothetical protein [Clostridia bacterium]
MAKERNSLKGSSPWHKPIISALSYDKVHQVRQKDIFREKKSTYVKAFVHVVCAVSGFRFQAHVAGYHYDFDGRLYPVESRHV